MKIMRKSISLLLVAALLFNNIVPMVAYANIDLTDLSTTSKNNQFDNKGNIEIDTHLVLPLIKHQENKIEFTIKEKDNPEHISKINLNNEKLSQEGILETSINLGEQTIPVVATKRNNEGELLSGTKTGSDDKSSNLVYLSINLYSLNKGTYIIELSSPNYVTATTEVTLDNYSKRVNISNENGMFALGDLNADGKIDSTDSNIMLEAIENKDTSKDLNLDGKVDIADLNYITANIVNEAQEIIIENTDAILSTDMVETSIEGSVEGNLEDIFTGENTVTLKPAENGQIKLDLDFSKEEQGINMSEIRIGVGEENKPEDMEIMVESTDGEKIPITSKKDENTSDNTPSIKYPDEDTHAFSDKADNNTIVINLGKQVAVKKVTIIIKEFATEQNLADITKVEFLNNVKVETKKPDGFDTPKNIKVNDTVSEQLTISFQNVPNVTGYEIKINGPKKNDVIYQTTFTTFTIEDLENYKDYTIYVRSVNGEWRSDWSEGITASPKATRLPPVVDMVVATPGYSRIELSWKDMKDTTSYNIYYREVGEENFKSLKNITGTKHTLTGLKELVEYEIYVRGVNVIGEGTGSKIVKAKTLASTATIYPKYKLINDTVKDGKTNHIEDVILKGGEMTDGNKYAMVDDDYKTYWHYNSWSAGSHYNKYDVPTIILDKAYEMDEFVITVPDTFNYSFKAGTYNDNNQHDDTLIYYWNTDEEKTSSNSTVVPGILTAKKDENQQTYYVLKLEKPITANAIQVGLTSSSNAGSVEIAEIKFYEYDSLVDDVKKLFKDDLRVELNDGVNQERINELKERANTKDHDEYNPYRESILNDLAYAEKILNDEKINDVITLNPNISNTYNTHLGFAMNINDYQPLGVVARAGDQISVYVGSKGAVNAELVYTQYHAEANAWQKTSKKLVKGQNIFDVPAIVSTDVDKGGSLYIRYTATPDVNNPIKVRVSGGYKIPVLDLSERATEKEKKDAIKTYIEDLEKHNSSLTSKYQEKGLTYQEKESAIESTEVVTEYGLWSVSSKAAENALKGTNEEKINQLYESTEAFDEMMEMFYRQKGLSKNAPEKTDELPKARINIRYMKMFDGAFMYAGGYHIGIEYDSIGGLFTGKRQSNDSTGYFGWGISHEIGHQINQSTLVHAEVTNNVYALLAQTSNDKDSSRLEVSDIYPKIYEKVTSHTIGKPQNVFVTLGMYWQLHLAYDDNKTFDDTDSIYARINKLTRKEKLTGYTKDELLYIYASMAAKQDLQEFFTAWGLSLSDKALQYIANQNLPKETRKIMYLNDAARRYKLEQKDAMSPDTKFTDEYETPSVNNEAKEITLKFNLNHEDTDKILGYEIIRNGETIDFVTNTNTYVDHIGAENNRAYTYKVVAYDYYLTPTEAKVYEEVKITHDGSISSKNTFSIESNFKEIGELVDPENENFNYNNLSVNKLIDGQDNTGFNGTERIKSLSINGQDNNTASTSSPYVIINLNDKYSVSGINYKAIANNENTITKYKISVSKDKETWDVAREGTFSFDENNKATIYFKKPGTTSENQFYTFDNISYIKIEAIGNNGISGQEFDVIAPPGDNIDIESVGILKEDYEYEKDKIVPKDSVIIQGSYRGDPTFNVVTISSADNNNVIFSGEQLIFAELNDDHTVFEVADGTWIYILTKEEYAKVLENTDSIRANLYRVNDGETNEGARITSTSTKYKLKEYDSLLGIQIKGQGGE